jgi:uncharacterized protein RhaS with RHS repeats
MYDPTIGRWLEEDPTGFGAGDSNLYRYVNNSPTCRIDPSGLEVTDTGWKLQTARLDFRAGFDEEGFAIGSISVLQQTVTNRKGPDNSFEAWQVMESGTIIY